MTKYNHIYSPPAPVTLVSIRNPNTLETRRGVPMLLDTGSDLTLLPKATCDEIGLDIWRDPSLLVRAYEGTTSVAECVRLDLYFLHRRFRGLFLVYDSDEGILGRNILNQFPLLFDGPNLNWEKAD